MDETAFFFRAVVYRQYVCMGVKVNDFTFTGISAKLYLYCRGVV